MTVACDLMDSVAAPVGTANRTLAETSTALPPLVRELRGTVTATAPQLRQSVAHLDTTSLLPTHFVREVSERPLRIIGGVAPPPGLDPPAPEPPVTVDSEADTVPELRPDTVPGDGEPGSETDSLRDP